MLEIEDMGSTNGTYVDAGVADNIGSEDRRQLALVSGHANFPPLSSAKAWQARACWVPRRVTHGTCRCDQARCLLAAEAVPLVACLYSNTSTTYPSASHSALSFATCTHVAQRWLTSLLPPRVAQTVYLPKTSWGAIRKYCQDCTCCAIPVLSHFLPSILRG